MVTFLLLSACGPPLPAVSTIHGVQVVAIQSDPPQPEAFDQMTLDVWVADGIGLGTEVLVWLCTPFEERCLEAGEEEFNGLPLQLWTKVGTADPKMTVSTTFWPLLVSTGLDQIDPDDLPEELEGGKLVVWALACVPGYCPALEDIAIGPLPGSEAWDEIADGLAHPEEWVAAVPEGYASLAVKLVPLWRPGQPNEPDFTFDSTTESTTPSGRNRAPQLTTSTIFEPIPAPVEGFPPLRVRLDQFDPDAGDVLKSRAFTTSGLVTATSIPDGLGGVSLDVLWSPQAADADRSPQMFVVLDDERGGTAVWSSVPESGSSPCDHPAEVEFTNPAFPGDTVVAEFRTTPVPGVMVPIDGTVFGSDSLVVDVVVELRAPDTWQLLARGEAGNLTNWAGETCTGGFEVDVVSSGPIGTSAICDFGGSLVDVVATVSDSYANDLTIAAHTTKAILHLDDSLPCIED